MKVSTALFALVVRSLGVGALVCLLSWTLVECAPGATAERAAITNGTLVEGDVQTPAALRAELVSDVAREFNLDDGAFSRIPRRAANFLRFDFGRSWRDGTSVSNRLFSQKGSTTLLLLFSSLLIALVVSAIAAPRSARNPNSSIGELSAVLMAIVLSVPIPWLAMLALDTLAYGNPLSIAPKGGADSFGGALLPICVLAAVPTAVLLLHLRKAIQDASEAQWVVAARARGVEESRLWNRHLLKMALPTMLSLVPVMLAYLLAAIVVVERVFAVDGLGSMVASAAEQGDVPILVAFASLSAVGISATSLGMNAVSNVMDPRRRQQ